MSVIASSSSDGLIRVLSDLEIGQRYDVAIDDCCVLATFSATFLGREADDWHIGVFDNGVLLDGDRDWGGWSATIATAEKPGAAPTPG